MAPIIDETMHHPLFFEPTNESRGFWSLFGFARFYVGRDGAPYETGVSQQYFNAPILQLR